MWLMVMVCVCVCVGGWGGHFMGMGEMVGGGGNLKVKR